MPGVGRLVVHAEVLTPADLEREWGLSGGHIHHGELALDQLFTMRPLLGWSQYRTPNRRLVAVRRRHASRARPHRRIGRQRRPRDPAPHLAPPGRDVVANVRVESAVRPRKGGDDASRVRRPRCRVDFDAGWRSGRCSWRRAAAARPRDHSGRLGHGSRCRRRRRERPGAAARHRDPRCRRQPGAAHGDHVHHLGCGGAIRVRERRRRYAARTGAPRRLLRPGGGGSAPWRPAAAVDSRRRGDGGRQGDSVPGFGHRRAHLRRVRGPGGRCCRAGAAPASGSVRRREGRLRCGRVAGHRRHRRLQGVGPDAGRVP